MNASMQRRIEALERAQIIPDDDRPTEIYLVPINTNGTEGQPVLIWSKEGRHER